MALVVRPWLLLRKARAARRVGRGRGEPAVTRAPVGDGHCRCAAAIKLAALACLSGGDPQRLLRLPDASGLVEPGDRSCLVSEHLRPSDPERRCDSGHRAGVEELEAPWVRERPWSISSRPRSRPIRRSRSRRLLQSPIDGRACPGRRGRRRGCCPNPHLQAGASLVAYARRKAMQVAVDNLLLGENLLRVVWQVSAPHHGPGRDNKVNREEQVSL